MGRILCLLMLTLHLSAGDAKPQDEFWRALQNLCGRSFQGEITTNTTSHQLTGKLEIKAKACSANRVEVSFAIGDDRSRTWILTRTPTGLRLKHEHRKANGQLEKVTDYGGDTQAPGQATRQAFVVDEYTRGLVDGTDKNIWVFEFKDGYLAYELYKGDATPVFQARFSLT